MGGPSWAAAGDVGRAAGLVAAFVRSAAAETPAPAPGASARRGGVVDEAERESNRRVGLAAPAPAEAAAAAAAGAGRRWGMLAELMELLDRASREEGGREGGHRAPEAADDEDADAGCPADGDRGDAARLRAVCAAVAAALPRPPFRDARRALAAVALVSTPSGGARHRRWRRPHCAAVQHCQCSQRVRSHLGRLTQKQLRAGGRAGVEQPGVPARLRRGP